MKKLISTLVLGILLGLLVLCAWPVQADTNGTNPPACPPGERGHADRMDRLLDTLEEKGYDVSAIRAAAESGDVGTARSLLQQFMQENRDALPAPPGNSNRMDRLLDTLEEKGYDVSAIRAAAESGDVGTARSLLQQFMQENRDALPAPPGKKNGGGCLSDGTGITNPSGTQLSPGERSPGNRLQRGFMKQTITPVS
ncbi:MAG: hypothetical protein NQU46_08575 [Methanolinea sp.]|nr:hypothetical protein [Methanolinea sp.]